MSPFACVVKVTHNFRVYVHKALSMPWFYFIWWYMPSPTDTFLEQSTMLLDHETKSSKKRKKYANSMFLIVYQCTLHFLPVLTLNNQPSTTYFKMLDYVDIASWSTSDSRRPCMSISICDCILKCLMCLLLWLYRTKAKLPELKTLEYCAGDITQMQDYSSYDAVPPHNNSN